MAALAMASALAAPGASAAPRTAAATQAGPALRWTAATPDEMVDFAAARASAGGEDALAAIAVAYALSDRATPGRARQELTATAHTLEARHPELAADARWVAAALDPNPRAKPAGLVSHFSILGPFQDNGGGLARREGPEQPGAKWGDPDASYTWGAYDVRWREVPETAVSARGLPLDLMIHPRKESCSYLGSRITVPSRAPIVFSVASSGSVRLIWDGVDAGSSEAPEQGFVVDRLAAKVEAAPGDHLLGLKVCTAALSDTGRVRVRASTADGRDLALSSSANLAGLAISAPPKGAIGHLTTPLERAVAVGNNPAPTAALAASVLYTLGQADDQRSPRAPGLIDALAHRSDLSADMLAMAGWISPFGAARSGWLNRARERAIASGDEATASFAERRLTAARLSAKFADWAMAGLEREPLKSARDPEARLLRAMVRSSLGLDSLKRAALADLVEMRRALGDRMPIAAWQELARLAGGFDAALAADAHDALARLDPESSDLERAESMQARDRDAVRAAGREALESGAITTDTDLVGLADLFERAGLPDDAFATFRLATMLSPNRASGWHGLAEAFYARGKTDPARLALARARELEPSEAEYKAELAFRGRATRLDAPHGAPGPSDAPAEAATARTSGSDHGTAEDGSAPGAGTDGTWPDLRYLVPPAEFLARKARDPAVKGEVADRQLHWTRVVTLHADRRVSQLIHYSREIVIEPRTQDELYENIPAEGDETEIVRARVHRASGGVAFAEEEKSEGGRATIRWPDLKTGDVVEVAVRTWTSGPVGRRGDPPFYFIDYAGSVSTHPILYNEVVVDSPVDQPLAVDVVNGKPDRQSDQTRDGRRVIRLIWDKPVNVADEPLAPKPSETLPIIVGSTFPSWKAFRDWYQAAVDGFTQPDEQVRKLAADLTRGKATRDDKVKAIFDFVADDIRYVNYVSGEWWLPNRPQQVLARRQGDCDDKAILLITLLRAIGVDATEVLLQTRYTAEPSVLLSKKAAIPLFDHGIAYLPGPGGAPGIWLDATSPQSRMGPIPAMDARTYALFASQGPPEMIRTPASAPDDHAIDGTWTIRLDASGAGDLDADERHTGDHAFVLRSNLREKDARAQWVEQNLLAGWFPTVEVGKNVDFESDLAHGAARVHYRARSDGLAHHEGDELVLPLAPAQTMTSQLAPLVHRTLPVVLSPELAPSSQVRRMRIVAPPGYRVGELPPGGVVDGGPFGRAELDIRRDPHDARTVLVRRRVVFDMSTIPVDRYGAWRDWLQKVDALLHRSIRMVTAANAAKGKS